MNDKELLKFAAKAAGMYPQGFQLDDEEQIFYEKKRGISLAWGVGWWNPLTDDGDALRLVVKLNFRLECMTLQTAASTFDRKISEPVDHTIEKERVRWPFEQCPYAATRRAIVRAAAEIGKSL
jgi:hypothetical protein